MLLKKLSASGESVPEALYKKSTAVDLWFTYSLWFTVSTQHNSMKPKGHNKTSEVLYRQPLHFLLAQ